MQKELEAERTARDKALSKATENGERVDAADREGLEFIGFHLPSRPKDRDLLVLWKGIAQEYTNVADSLTPWMDGVRDLRDSTESKEVRELSDAVWEIGWQLRFTLGLMELEAKMNRVLLWRGLSKDELKTIREEYEESWKIVKKVAETAKSRHNRGEQVYG